MPYQNNNNRLTPQTTGKKQITPQTQIVNKELKYQPELSNTQKFTYLADSLASIGRGILDYDQSGILQKKAQEQAIELHAGEIGKNQQAWKEVQKQVRGLNILNPYNKPAYQNLVTGDMYAKALTELKSDPDYYKRKPQEIEKFINEKEQTFKALITENEIPVSVSGKYLEAFRNECQTFYKEYAIKNAEYNTLNLHKKIESKTSRDLRTGWYNVEKGNQGQVLQDVLNNMVQENPSMPEGDILELFNKALTKGIAAHTETLESAAIINEAKNIELNGIKLSDIIPDLELNLRDTFKNTELERMLEIQRQDQFNEKQAKAKYKEAEKDFNQTLIDNPDISVTELAQEMCKKYEIPEYYDEMLTQLMQMKQVEKNIGTLDTDKTMLNELTIQAGLGQMSTNKAAIALKSGQIDEKQFKELITFNNSVKNTNESFMTKSNATAYKAVSDEVYQYINNLTTKKELQKTSKDNTLSPYAIYSNALKEINTKVTTGELSINQGEKALRQLKSDIERRHFTEKSTIDIKYSPARLLDNQYVNTLRNPDDVNPKTAYRKYGELGIIQKQVFDIKQDKLVKDKKFSPDMQYAAKISMPKDFGGEVKYIGENAELGKFILIQLDNGYYLRLTHLAAIRSNLKTGTKLTKGDRKAIGHSGYDNNGNAVFNPKIFAPDGKTIAGINTLLLKRNGNK